MNEAWKFFRDTNGEYRWQRVTKNKKLILKSQSGFENCVEAVSNAQKAGYLG